MCAPTFSNDQPFLLCKLLLRDHVLSDLQYADLSRMLIL